MALGEPDRFVRIDVSENQQNRIRRRVICFKEFLDVIQSGRVQIVKIAVKIVGVRPIAIGDRRKIEPGKTAVGLVEHVDAHFFFHDVALVAQIFVVHLQRAHAVGLEPQDALQRIRGHRLVVIRDVIVRRAVQHAAGRIDQLDVHHFPGVGRALKHHVLEQMSEAAAAARLDAKPDIVIDAHRSHRRCAVRRNDHAQAVRQRRAFDWNVQLCQEAPCG